MKARPWNRLALLVWMGVFLLACAARTQAQQPAPPPTSSSSPSQTQSAPPNDLAAQEDALIKLCNEQINVKGQFKEAEELAKQAVDLSQKMGDKKRVMVALLYLGSAYFYQGRLPEALEAFQRNEALARELGNKKGLSRVLNNIAGVLGELGRYEESLSYLNQCMVVARELGDQPMQYTALLNIGQLYTRLGDPDKAEAPLLEALRTGRELKHSDLVSNPSKYATEQTLLSLGEMEVAREHYQAALKYYEQVRASQPENALFVAGMLSNMAEVHEKLGNHQESIQLFQEAMAVAEKAAATGMYARIVSSLGRSQESLGQIQEALASQNRALALVRQSGGNPDDEWQIESRIGHVDRALGHNEEALAHYQNSISGIEHLRAVALNTEPGQASFVGRSRRVYTETANLLYDLHHEAEALEMVERGRARAFLEMLAVSRSGVPDELTSEQRQREDAKLARISTVQKAMWKENLPPGVEKRFKAELVSAEDDLEAFHLEMRQASPRYASIHYPEPISISEIQNRLLDNHAALVEYLLGEKRTLVWVVTKNKLTTASLPAQKEIEEQVAAYRKVLSERASALTVYNSLAEVKHLGAKLFSSLFQPIETATASSRTLIIVPDGALDYLPFEALVAGSAHGTSGESQPSYLLEKFAVVYGPSASALVTVRAMNREAVVPSKTLLAFGDPVATASPVPVTAGVAAEATRSVTETAGSSPAADYTERGFSFARLPYTREEVVAISKLFPISQRQVYLGDEAREETVKAEKLNEFRYIHFASHGFIDEAKPGRSGILLSRAPQSSEDGVLQMGEIMRLKMNADLVTLSACSTGLGKLVSGEGILGLTRAFFYSGARNVTVSLWNVNDSATAALMQAYYGNLKRGLSKSASLRQAKLALLRGKNVTWSQPYFWAGFILVGEGK